MLYFLKLCTSHTGEAGRTETDYQINLTLILASKDKQVFFITHLYLVDLKSHCQSPNLSRITPGLKADCLDSNPMPFIYGLFNQKKMLTRVYQFYRGILKTKCKITVKG